MALKVMVKWGVPANTSTRRLPADFTLPGIAAFVAAGTEYKKINQLINQTPANEPIGYPPLLITSPLTFN